MEAAGSRSFGAFLMIHSEKFRFAGESNRLLCCSYGSDVRIYALIPVQEAFHVDLVANLEILDSCVDIGRIIAQIGFYSEGIGLAV